MSRPRISTVFKRLTLGMFGRPPVTVVLIGPPGGGKSALLAALYNRQNASGSVASVDLRLPAIVQGIQEGMRRAIGAGQRR